MKALYGLVMVGMLAGAFVSWLLRGRPEGEE